jgi:hypothetical protein
LNGDGKERWIELCGQAAIEQDPSRLLALTNEIIRLLEEKEARLQPNPPRLALTTKAHLLSLGRSLRVFLPHHGSRFRERRRARASLFSLPHSLCSGSFDPRDMDIGRWIPVTVLRWCPGFALGMNGDGDKEPSPRRLPMHLFVSEGSQSYPAPPTKLRSLSDEEQIAF